VKKIALIVVFFNDPKPVFPLVDYAVNYDYITTVLCENKQNRLFNVMENVI
jgi:hypothetical protein